MRVAMVARQLIEQPQDEIGSTMIPPALAERLSQRARQQHARYPANLIEYRLLCSLAVSGWSHRLSHAWAATLDFRTHKPRVQEDSGTFKRAFLHLQEAGLWTTDLVPLHGSNEVPLVSLTPLGRDLLADAGLPPAPTEVEVIAGRHRGAEGGQPQRGHTAAICAFTHYARILGYDTEVCPDVSDNPIGLLEPDVKIVDDVDAITFVEVQRRGGRREQWAEKCLGQFAGQGFAAICAVSPQQALRYAYEARRAGVGRGFLTYLLTLYHERPASLWTHRWEDRVGPLVEVA